MARPQRGFEMGAHLGVSVLAGNAERGLPLASRVGTPPSFALELGYRLSPRLSLGGLLVGAVGVVQPSPCPEEGYRCRFGALGAVVAMGRYHLPVLTRFEPWLGAGVGLGVSGESATLREPPADDSSGFCFAFCRNGVATRYTRDTTRFGPELVLAAGLAWRVSPRVALGVAAHAMLGAYLAARREDKVSGGREEREVEGRSVGGGAHLWLLPTAHLTVSLGRVEPAAPAEPPHDP